MKTCSKCKQPKDETEFPWRNKSKNKRASWCLVCKREYDQFAYANDIGQGGDRAASRVRNRKQGRKRTDLLIWNYLLEHPCMDCGESDILVLEFDHIGDDKAYNISGMGGFNLEKVKAEIQKCEVVCRNCHIRRTGQRANWAIISFRDRQIGKVAWL